MVSSVDHVKAFLILLRLECLHIAPCHLGFNVFFPTWGRYKVNKAFCALDKKHSEVPTSCQKHSDSHWQFHIFFQGWLQTPLFSCERCRNEQSHLHLQFGKLYSHIPAQTIWTFLKESQHLGWRNYPSVLTVPRRSFQNLLFRSLLRFLIVVCSRLPRVWFGVFNGKILLNQRS